jgi:hypothetical protein
MVAVVVHDHHAAALAAHLEAPLGAGEFRERLGDPLERHLELESDGDGAQRVEQVVPAGNLEPQCSEHDLLPVDPLDDGAARAERLELHIESGDVRTRFATKAVGDHAAHRPRYERAHRDIIGAQDCGAVERHLVDELEKRAVQRLPAAVGLHVLAIDVRDQRQRRRQLEERPVAFIRLDDHRLAPSEPRVAAERAQPAANHRGWIEAGAFQDQRDHRRGRGLAMGAGDGDPVAQAHQLGEHLGARNHGNAAAPRLDDFRIRRGDRRRHHDHVGGADVCGVVPEMYSHAELCQPLRHVRFPGVRTRYLVPEIGEQLGDAAHADASDTDEVHPPRPPQHPALGCGCERRRLPITALTAGHDPPAPGHGRQSRGQRRAARAPVPHLPCARADPRRPRAR